MACANFSPTDRREGGWDWDWDLLITCLFYSILLLTTSTATNTIHTTSLHYSSGLLRYTNYYSSPIHFRYYTSTPTKHTTNSDSYSITIRLIHD